tara:strand:- start:23 stop:217 length:195 start_codon:yes stop_codon:yes gene_type:complete
MVPILGPHTREVALLKRKKGSIAQEWKKTKRWVAKISRDLAHALGNASYKLRRFAYYLEKDDRK